MFTTRQLLFFVLATALTSSAIACDTDQPPLSTQGVGFEELGRVSFVEDSRDPIVGISALSRRPGGGFIIVDEQADKVRLFDSAGRIETVLGGSGEGPGELEAPTAAVELLDGRVYVVQRSSPRLTIFTPDSDPEVRSIPGRYGTWLHDLGDRLVAGIGSRGDRFVIVSETGDSIASFGALDPEVNRTPFWIYYARESATVAGDRIAINTSFYPTIRLFAQTGDSLGMIGHAPPDWLQATEPPVDRALTPSDRQIVQDWSAEFTVVVGLAGLPDGRLVVQYGRHAPTEAELYRVEPSSVDVYDSTGDKLAEGIRLDGRVLAGGDELLVLVAEPPEPWTVARYRWGGTPD